MFFLPVTTVASIWLCGLYIFLSFQVIRIRRKHQIGVGDGGNILLRRAIRAHSNFSEYVPLTLCLMLLAELQGVHQFFLTIVATAFVSARVCHAYGVAQAKENLFFRIKGMQGTFISLVSLSLSLVVKVLMNGVL